MALKHTVSAIIAAMVCLGVLTGCSTMKTTWRSTKKLYRNYINTDPSIDFSDQGITDKGLQRLAALFMPVDERLMNMMRALGCQDTPPESDWAQQFLANYPWLSALVVLDGSGGVRFQAPAVSMRPLDFAPLMEFAERFKLRKLAATVTTDEFGTVVMLAAPYFENNEWTGLVVAVFDPRNLLRFSPAPQELAVVSSDGTAWPGGSEAAGSLTGVKWNDILKSTVQGEMGVGTGKWVWVSRYLGQLHVIYLTDAQSARATKPAAAAPPAAPAETAPVDAATPPAGSATPAKP